MAEGTSDGSSSSDEDCGSSSSQKAAVSVKKAAPLNSVNPVSRKSIVNLTFQVRYKPVKAKPLKLCIMGTLPELGQCCLESARDPRVYVKYERHLQDLFKKRKKINVSDGLIRTSWGNDPQVTLFEDLFDSRVISLELAEEDTNLENLWSTKPIKIHAEAGTKFSYIYMVWNMQDKNVWESPIEACVRTREVPSMVKCKSHDRYGNVSYEYTFRDNQISNLRGDLEGASSKFDYGDDEDSDDDID